MKRCHVIGMTVTGATMRANLLGKAYLIVHCSNLSNLLSAKKHLILRVLLQSHFEAFCNQARAKLCWENYRVYLFQQEHKETKSAKTDLVSLHPLFALFSLLCAKAFHKSWQKNFLLFLFYILSFSNPVKPVTFH